MLIIQINQPEMNNPVQRHQIIIQMGKILSQVFKIIMSNKILINF
jgi:hypothetical protein